MPWYRGGSVVKGGSRLFSGAGSLPGLRCVRYFEFRWPERFFLKVGQTRASCQRDAILVTEVQAITQSFVMVLALRGCVARLMCSTVPIMVCGGGEMLRDGRRVGISKA